MEIEKNLSVFVFCIYIFLTRKKTMTPIKDQQEHETSKIHYKLQPESPLYKGSKAFNRSEHFTSTVPFTPFSSEYFTVAPTSHILGNGVNPTCYIQSHRKRTFLCNVSKDWSIVTELSAEQYAFSFSGENILPDK